VLANSVLHQWRLPAFYGDETLNVGGLFEESEARLALSYADSAQFVCSIVRFHVYQLAAAAQIPSDCVQPMKLHHAAALALVGWYLMVPPRRPTGGSTHRHRCPNGKATVFMTQRGSATSAIIAIFT
jgi:hypothetical protein